MSPSNVVRKRARRAARAGMTLLEMMVALTIVALLALVLLSANVPMSRASSQSGVAFDMDRTAGKFLSELRREVRQSGLNGTTRLIDVPDPTTLGPFRKRLEFGDVADDTTDSNWSREITYTLVQNTRVGAYADGVLRYRVVRSQAGSVSADVLDNVRSLTFAEVAGSDTISVVLVLRRENPTWDGVDPARRYIERTYSEEIEFLNKG